MRINEVNVSLEVNDGLSRRWRYEVWADLEEGEDPVSVAAEARIILSKMTASRAETIPSELPDVNARPWEARDE